jgi:cell division protein FtsL
VSWPWIVLLSCAVAVVIAAEWSRVNGLFGAEARRQRERNKRKATFRVIRTEEEEFAASVERDLAELPTIEEKDRR